MKIFIVFLLSISTQFATAHDLGCKVFKDSNNGIALNDVTEGHPEYDSEEESKHYRLQADGILFEATFLQFQSYFFIYATLPSGVKTSAVFQDVLWGNLNLKIGDTKYTASCEVDTNGEAYPY